MKKAELDGLIRLLDDEDREVWKNISQTILDVGQVAVPRLVEVQENNPNPLAQERSSYLIRRLRFETLRTELVRWKDAGATNLLDAMRILASYENPTLQTSTLNQEVEELYTQAWVDLGANSSPTEKIKLFNGTFFDSLGFKPTAPDHFYELGNSLIDKVLGERKGNPISLCIVYMLIAQRMGMPVYGVNLPNLFILIYDAEDLRFYINVFNRGSLFTRHEIDAYLQRLNIDPIPPYYEPCNHEAIVRRVLRNMMVAYEQQHKQEEIDDIYRLLQAWA